MKDLKIENCYHCPLRENSAFNWCGHKDFEKYEVEIIDVDIIHPKCPLNNHITNDVLDKISSPIISTGELLDIITMNQVKVRLPKVIDHTSYIVHREKMLEAIRDHFRRKV